ncbi:MAG: insulinase family protein, partial [Opitutales bacterium]|nr:insulinase family protein [Opitutales bacterium]
GTAASSAARLGAECVERGDPAATKIFLEKINALTPEDIRRVAQKYLRDESVTTSAFEKTPSRKKVSASASTGNADKKHAFPPFEETRLACGIRVLLQPVSGLPKVHLRASMLGGGAFESEKTRGATALLSTLMTLDAGTRSASEIAEKIESVGGRFDEISGNNTFALFAETLSGDENLSCEILADAICSPRFSEENFARERATQLAALRSEFDEIEEFARIALREKFFGAHPLGAHNFGTEDALEALSLNDIRTLHAKLAVPENIVIAASGEFERNALLSELEKQFSPERFANCARVPAEDFAKAFRDFSAQKSREIEIPPPVPAEQAIVQLAFPDFGFCDERYRVGTLADELLSGMSSRLFLEIREKRGLAYFVGASRIGSPRTGMFFLYAGTEKGKAQIVLDEMRRELDRLRAGKISGEELAGAKTRICVAQRTARQRASSRCGNAALNALYGLPVNRDAETEARLGALTADDVARFATEILAAEKSLALTVK